MSYQENGTTLRFRQFVEFSRENGTTTAWFAVRQNEVQPYTASDLLKVS